MLHKDKLLQNKFCEHDVNPLGGKPGRARLRTTGASLVVMINMVVLLAILLAGAATIGAARAQTTEQTDMGMELPQKTELRGNRNLVVGTVLSLAAIALIGFGARHRNATARSITFHPKTGRRQPPSERG